MRGAPPCCAGTGVMHDRWAVWMRRAAMTVLLCTPCFGARSDVPLPDVPLPDVAGFGVPPLRPPHGALIYSQEFAQSAAPADFAARYPGLATWAYFGGEPALRAAHAPLTNPAQWSSRTWGGLLDVYIDPQYCPGALTPSVTAEGLAITAYRLSPDAAQSCGHGSRPWGSSIVTSMPSFAQAYGYWEVEAKLPCVPGRWPAFWLLPATKTPANGGRLAEIDVFEHYGGPVTVMSGGRPFVIDRVGTPYSTLHYGTIGDEQKLSNVPKLPVLNDAQRAEFCASWHRFGVLWTHAEFRFTIDGRETLRAPNPGVDDPHYWVLNLDISRTAGDPDADPGASRYLVRYVKVWRP